MSSADHEAKQVHLPLVSPESTGSAPTGGFTAMSSQGVADGHQVFQVSDHEALFSNEELIAPLQPYPGAALPRIPGRTAYPIPDQVGRYAPWSEFVKAPKYMAQWVHWTERAEQILQGKYDEVLPAHYEGIFTLVCNFMCPHCSRRVTRTKWVEGGTWEHNTEIEKKNTMHPLGLKRVIDELAQARTDDQMGIVWGGGDPTANPYTYDGMAYARARGITSSFLTNGTFLEVDRCLEADPTLIRVSLNCGTEQVYQKFHGYPRGWDYFERVKESMRTLARRKLETGARTLVGISLIADERNMQDIVAAAEEIRAVVDESGPGIDYVIARPVMNYEHFDQPWARLKDDTKRRGLDLVTQGGEAWQIFHDLGIPLILIKDSFDEPPPPESYASGTDCLAYGLYGEIRHNGDVQLCSDSYGNPEFTVGNIFDQDLRDIWTSDRRKQVLAERNAKRCFQTTCPHNSRGHHHNRVFHQIEQFRREGRMAEVRRWVQDLREVTHPLGHSFFV
ncbi:MAG: radical SAM protein [Pseudonocardiaceae bacterium]|nr:radical SAM protein [Pseudonocardiaceae bacterium]